jgi:methylmalonyl-CoA/ethylmalonyl-CoA epimerase
MSDVNARKLHHIGIVVKDLDAVVKFYQDTLGLPLTRIEEVSEQGVKIAFLPIGDTEIELVQPTDPTSGVAGFLEKRGEGVHHICFEVGDIEAALADLAAQGVRLIDEKPKVGSQGQKMAFIHPKSAHGVLVELYQLDK